MTAIAIVFTILYVAGVALISLKLRDIMRNREKYSELDIYSMAIAREKEKKHLKSFQSLGHQYIVLTSPVWIISTILAIMLLRLMYRITAGTSTILLTESWLAGGIGALFILFPVMGIISLYIKTPFFAVMSLARNTGGTRYTSWKDEFIILLVTFTIGFPFYGFSANNYIYYDDEGITTSAYFQFDETYTAYEEITKVRILANHNEYKDLTSLSYYVTLADGREIEMAGDSKIFFSDSLLELHKKIEKHSSAEFEINPPTKEDMTYLDGRLSSDMKENIIYIFEGRH